MKNIIRSSSAIAVGVAAALAMASTAFASSYDPSKDLGSPGEDQMVDRVITITPDTKWVNVSENETVKFVDQATGQSFVWDFATIDPDFSLNTVAPSGDLGGQQITVYVDVPVPTSD